MTRHATRTLLGVEPCCLRQVYRQRNHHSAQRTMTTMPTTPPTRPPIKAAEELLFLLLLLLEAILIGRGRLPSLLIGIAGKVLCARGWSRQPQKKKYTAPKSKQTHPAHANARCLVAKQVKLKDGARSFQTRIRLRGSTGDLYY